MDTEISTDASLESVQSDDEDTDTSVDTCNPNRSCPDLRSVTEDTLKDHKNTIANLETRLQTAEEEINNLILENGTLKKVLEEREQTIKKLTHICSSPADSIKKKKRNRKNLSSIKMDVSQTEVITSDDKIEHIQSDTNQSEASGSISPPVRCYQTDQSPSRYDQADQPPDRHDQADHPPDRHAQADQPNQEPTSTPVKQISESSKCTVKAAGNEKQVKLCILSNHHKKLRTLQAIQSTFDQDADFCHYTVPNGGIKALLSNLDNKLKHFTLNDYCIIFLGENDISRSECTITLVNYLRETLKKITHTNKIICLPTYVCGALIYNYKVEMFNNLLTMDMQTNNYAYIFDTNRDLTLDMFSYSSGKIMKRGIRSALLSLNQFIAEIQDRPGCINESIYSAHSLNGYKVNETIGGKNAPLGCERASDADAAPDETNKNSVNNCFESETGNLFFRTCSQHL
ncbi:uncharacterized protein LOC133531299 [Cydia pomonella]|uniref:uncharacterized protein LOC133531299 n=1 Tax=Cydia pomonella TaxID=82600 RepID=UPI002ADE2A5C|nr:uncharacterized protein LOC133531299 [Cydia pomonella]